MKKIVYAPSSTKDVAWFYSYYEDRPELAKNGLSNYRKTKNTLASFPLTGRPIKGDKYQKSVPNTPFIIVYKLRGNYLVILRIKDTRGIKIPK